MVHVAETTPGTVMPSASRTTTVNRAVPLIGALALVGVIATLPAVTVIGNDTSSVPLPAVSFTVTVACPMLTPRINPFALTVAIAVALDANDTVPPVAPLTEIWAVRPATIVPLSSEARSAMTQIDAEPVRPPLAAEIVAFPMAMPVTIPVDAPTVATFAFVVLHVTGPGGVSTSIVTV
jgi:hypothetical protein